MKPPVPRRPKDYARGPPVPPRPMMGPPVPPRPHPDALLKSFIFIMDDGTAASNIQRWHGLTPATPGPLVHQPEFEISPDCDSELRAGAALLNDINNNIDYIMDDKDDYILDDYIMRLRAQLSALRRRAATRHCSAEVVQRSWRAYRLRVERWQYGGERDEAPGEAARHRGAAAEDGVERRCGAAGEKRWSDLYHPDATRVAALAGGQPPEWPILGDHSTTTVDLRRNLGLGTATRKLGGSARSVHHEGSARSGLARRKMEKTAAAAATKSLRLEARGL